MYVCILYYIISYYIYIYICCTLYIIGIIIIIDYIIIDIDITIIIGRRNRQRSRPPTDYHTFRHESRSWEKSRHFCEDPVGPEPVWKLSTPEFPHALPTDLSTSLRAGGNGGLGSNVVQREGLSMQGIGSETPSNQLLLTTPVHRGISADSRYICMYIHI